MIGLGANLGDKARTLASAVTAIGEIATITAVSSLYETDPVGPPQPDYLNAAVRVLYDGTPRGLLAELLSIERRFGRERRERFGPRILDLDLLFAAGLQVNDADLVVPHARLQQRAFALAPLLDVMPDAQDPGSGERLSEWLARVVRGGIRRIAGPEWAAHRARLGNGVEPGGAAQS